MNVLQKLLFALLWFFSGMAYAQAPVAFVLAAGDDVVVTNSRGQRYFALPTQQLSQGHTVSVPKGQRFSLALLNKGERRVFNGPASLKVIADAVRVQRGPSVKVFSLAKSDMVLIDQWMRLYPRFRSVADHTLSPESDKTPLQVLEPLNGSRLLTRSPEFVFKGELPREGNLVLFDSNGKRFWVEPIESEYVTLPSAAKFEWGQSFTWEVRRLTGGRVLSGTFHIASEEMARTLLRARIPDLPSSLPESMLFYGMRLQLVNAFKEADDVWGSLGIEMSQQGQPSRL